MRVKLIVKRFILFNNVSKGEVCWISAKSPDSQCASSFFFWMVERWTQVLFLLHDVYNVMHLLACGAKRVE